MDGSSQSVLFILAGIVLGSILGASMALLLSRRAKETQKEPASTPALPVAEPPPLSVLPTLPSSARPGAVVFWRESPGSPLQVEMEEQTFKAAGDLSPEQRRRLFALLGELARWFPSRPGSQTPPARVESAQPQVRPAAAQPEPLKPRQTRPSLSPPAPVPSGPARSIVEQINDVLQERIAGTPLAAQGLRLQDDLRQGLVVWLGIKHYPGIDAVPDPAVREVIRSAAKEWEQQSSQG